MIRNYLPYFTLALIGLANALPVPLTGTTLSLYLLDAGFEKDMIGLFMLLAFPFSLKLLWIGLIDTRPPPLFRNTPRKGWLLFSLLGMIVSLVLLALVRADAHPVLLACSLLMLSSFTGCLYVVGLSYELESIEERNYSIGSSSVTAGYRTGLLCAGAGVLWLAYMASWSVAFLAMGALLAVVAGVIVSQPEPFNSHNTLLEKRKKRAANGTIVLSFCKEVIVEPCRDFFQNSDFKSIIMIVLLFKAGDHLTKAMEGPFYIDIGFDKADIAFASKTWGFATTILGTLLAGALLKNRNPSLSVAFMGLVHASALFGLWLQAVVGKSYLILYASVMLSHITGGMAMCAFIFFLWRVCTKHFAAVQYALLYSLYTLKSDLLAVLGGYLAHHTAWSTFFWQSGLISLTASLAIGWLSLQQNKSNPVTIK